MMATRPSDLATGLHLLEQACASGLWGEMLYACGVLWSQLIIEGYWHAKEPIASEDHWLAAIDRLVVVSANRPYGCERLNLQNLIPSLARGA
jgi:hypothetical protein